MLVSNNPYALDHPPARGKAGQAAGRAQSQWQVLRADAAAKMRDLRDRIERKRDELDVKMAEDDAVAMRWASPGGRPSRLR